MATAKEIARRDISVSEKRRKGEGKRERERDREFYPFQCSVVFYKSSD